MNVLLTILLILAFTFTVAEISRWDLFSQCGELIWASSTNLLFTETQPVPGNVYSRRVPFQVKSHITNLLYSITRQSFSAAFWITATVKKHTNLTRINLLGISWSKLVTCPSQGMITRCHRLMETNSLFLEDSSLVPESTNATFVLRMAEHSTGSK